MERRQCTRKRRRTKLDAELYAARHGELQAYKRPFYLGWHVGRRIR
jgi:hypothetical protein